MNVRDLEPKEVWNNFEDLNVSQDPLKRERVISFIKNFGQKLNLSTYEDPCGNVIITKPATIGMEIEKQLSYKVT